MQTFYLVENIFNLLTFSILIFHARNMFLTLNLFTILFLLHDLKFQ